MERGVQPINVQHRISLPADRIQKRHIQPTSNIEFHILLIVCNKGTFNQPSTSNFTSSGSHPTAVPSTNLQHQISLPLDRIQRGYLQPTYDIKFHFLLIISNGGTSNQPTTSNFTSFSSHPTGYIQPTYNIKFHFLLIASNGVHPTNLQHRISLAPGRFQREYVQHISNIKFNFFLILSNNGISSQPPTSIFTSSS